MKHFYEDVDGWFWFLNAYERLLDTLPTDRRSVWVELGNYKGRSLAWLLVAAANKPVQLEVIGVDVVAQLDERVLTFRNFLSVIGDSAKQASQVPNETIDVVWIDADHGYEAVLRDIDAWWPKLRVGGYMGGDDYADDGVMRAVHERFPSHEVGQGVAADGGPWPWWLVRKP